MTPDKPRYFLAVVLPSPLLTEVTALKDHVRDQYKSKAALNAPAHITLHMPFEWKAGKEEVLKEKLRKFSAQVSPVKIELEDFGCFPPRVIFITVCSNEKLTAIQSIVKKFCRLELGLLNANYKDLPFHPHVTIAFRDLKKKYFPAAWEAFRSKKFAGTFLADKLCLLKHSGSTWEVLESFPLAEPTASGEL